MWDFICLTPRPPLSTLSDDSCQLVLSDEFQPVGDLFLCCLRDELRPVRRGLVLMSSVELQPVRPGLERGTRGPVFIPSLSFPHTHTHTHTHHSEYTRHSPGGTPCSSHHSFPKTHALTLRGTFTGGAPCSSHHSFSHTYTHTQFSHFSVHRTPEFSPLRPLNSSWSKRPSLLFSQSFH